MNRTWRRRLTYASAIAALGCVAVAAPVAWAGVGSGANPPAEATTEDQGSAGKATIAPGLHSTKADPGTTASPRINGVDPSDPNAPKALLIPTSGTVHFTVQRQNTPMSCVPASGSMSLETFGLKVSENTLAKKMGTDSSGTRGSDAVPVMNSYVKSKGYRYTFAPDVANNTNALLTRAGIDIGIYKKAPVIGVWAEELPWNAGRGLKNNTGHAIVIYSYDLKKKTVKVADPGWDRTFKLSAKKLAAATQESGGMWYITRL